MVSDNAGCWDGGGGEGGSDTGVGMGAGGGGIRRSVRIGRWGRDGDWNYKGECQDMCRGGGNQSVFCVCLQQSDISQISKSNKTRYLVN